MPLVAGAYWADNHQMQRIAIPHNCGKNGGVRLRPRDYEKYFSQLILEML